MKAKFITKKGSNNDGKSGWHQRSILRSENGVPKNWYCFCKKCEELRNKSKSNNELREKDGITTSEDKRSD